MCLLADLDAFYLEHRRCGKLDTDVTEDVSGVYISMSCSCGGWLNRLVDARLRHLPGAGHLTAERMVRWLALRAPAIYKDADFDRPKRELNLDAGLSAYRGVRLSPAENRVLTAASRFAGDVLVVESEHGTVIPHQVVENYLRAFAVAARSVTHSVLRGADHGLSRTSSRKAYRKILEDWFRTSGDTWAEVGSHQAMNRSRSMER